MRLIDANKLKKTMLAEIERLYRVGHPYSATVVSDVIEKLDLEPSVDAEPVVHGHWIDNGNGGVYCSKCKFLDSLEDEFRNAIYDLKSYSQENKRCRNCGAKMDEEQSSP